MPLVETDAIVLHAFDYSETSRILRLATREAGLQSVLARGARRSKSRFGTAVDLFAQGSAQLHLREGRDLQTLSAFDVTRARPALADAAGRFTGASALAELALRFGAADHTEPALFDVLAEALDRVAAAPAASASEAALAGAWRLLAELGFAPSLDQCAVCHAPVPTEVAASFHHTAGGVLCARCAARDRAAGRTLPPDARARITAWSAGRGTAALSASETRAHQRVLREFLQYHLSDARPLRAFAAWETGGWDQP